MTNSSRSSETPPPGEVPLRCGERGPSVAPTRRAGAPSVAATARSATTGTPLSDRTIVLCGTLRGDPVLLVEVHDGEALGATVSSKGSGVPFVSGSSRRTSTSTSATRSPGL